MSYEFDQLTYIVETGTPGACKGCHLPLIKAAPLVEQVQLGELTEDAAADSLRAELEETCLLGRAVYRTLGSKCMNGETCTIGFVPLPASRRKWDWEVQTT